MLFSSIVRKLIPAAVLLGLLLPRSSLAVGELNGRIAGVVSDEKTKIPLPGATIVVRSREMPGGSRSVTTDEEGRFDLVELPPGSYDIEVSYAGVKPLLRRAVVRQGELLPLSILWSPELSQTGTTVIVEERHLTRPDSTQTGTVLTKDSQNRIASGRRYQDALQQAAGVTGASLTGTGGNPNIKGGHLKHNRWLVDGMDITDPVSNQFQTNFNFDSICSMDVLTGGMEAQYNSLGGVIGLNTCAGSAEWHVDSSFYFNQARLSLGSQYGAGALNTLRPFANLDPPPSQSYQANLNVGGPIRKKDLWFNFSFEYLYRETGVPAGPPLNVQQPSGYNHRFLTRLKLTYAPSHRHLLTLSVNGDPAYFIGNNGNAALPVVQNRQNQGGAALTLQWDAFLRKNLNTTVQTGLVYSSIRLGPLGILGDGLGSLSPSDYGGMFSARNAVYDPDRPQHINNDDGTLWYQGNKFSSLDRYSMQLDPSVSIRGRWLGSHDAKVGVQSRFVYQIRSEYTPGDRVYVDAGGGPLEAGICDFDDALGVPAEKRTGNGCFQYRDQPGFGTRQWGLGAGLFAQDRWKVLPWLTIVPGLRFDYGYTQNSQGEGATSLWGFGPRLGILADLTRDQKTMLSFYYGRANETLSLAAANRADLTAVTTTYQWYAAGKMFSKAFETGGAGGYRIDPDAKAPFADEWTVAFRREIFRNSVGQVEYTFKRIANLWEAVEINQVWDPTGTKVLRYDNGVPQPIYLYTTRESSYRQYHGLDFILEGRPTANWDLFAAYTLSYLSGSAGGMDSAPSAGESQFSYPRLTHLYDGYLPEDQRHQLKVRLSYNWRGLNIGAFFSYATGRPLTKLYFNQTDGTYTLRRTSQGTEPGSALNDPASVTELRLPDLLLVDARVSFDLERFLRGRHLIVILDLFNVFNLAAPTSIEARDVPTFGTVQQRQPPLRFQLGLRYTY